MTGRLVDKVALVTGAGSGIGRASAIAFAKEGAQVVVVGRSKGNVEETLSIIKENGGEAISLIADVSKSSDVQAMVKKVIEAYGRLDSAFNNAGVAAPPKVTPDTSEEDWDRIISINLKGVWLCMKYEIPEMLKQKKGAIVNMSSMLGLIGLAKRSAYAASKHGVVGLTKVAALEYADAGIRINAICPAVVLTPIVKSIMASDPQAETQLLSMIPMGRIGTLEEIAEVVVWLCSEGSSYITGHALSIDGGAVAK